MRLTFLLYTFFVVRALAQCPPVPAFSSCDIPFELDAAEAAANPNPYATVQIQAELRSPRHRTFLVPGFWDGGKRFVIRLTPVEPGEWVYRVTSNIPRFQGKEEKFQAIESDSAGFIKPANLHHWQYTESLKAHLWVGDTLLNFGSIDKATFQTIADARSKQKFNHLRGLVLTPAAFSAPDVPNPEYFRTLDERVQYLNKKGIIADLVIGYDPKLLGTWQQRERWIRFVTGHFAPMNVTWQIAENFEQYTNGRPLMKEMGLLLKRFDGYQHPRSAHSMGSSASLAADGWMTHVVQQSPDPNIGAVEHQFYAYPFVNTDLGYEEIGESPNSFTRRLWNATMNGQYPTYGHKGISGTGAVDAKYADAPGTKAMTAWHELFADTRHWELEPYFDVDGARALALDGVEYIIYIEKPSGPIEVIVEKHSYNVAWIDPATGERTVAKKFNAEKFVGEPPNRSHDWVLHLEREGRKAGMLNSYRFESRPNELQEIEQDPAKVPFTVGEPGVDTISLSKPLPFAIKVKRETRATRSMLYLWTGEVVPDGQGYRVVGTGATGTLNLPPNIALRFPAVLNIRVSAVNANGKAYTVDKVYQLTQ